MIIEEWRIDADAMQEAHQREWENRQQMLRDRFLGTCAIFGVTGLTALFLLSLLILTSCATDCSYKSNMYCVHLR